MTEWDVTQGFDCVSEELGGEMVVNWKAEETGVSLQRQYVVSRALGLGM